MAHLYMPRWATRAELHRLASLCGCSIDEAVVSTGIFPNLAAAVEKHQGEVHSWILLLQVGQGRSPVTGVQP